MSGRTAGVARRRSAWYRPATMRRMDSNNRVGIGSREGLR
ncbi:hypothetical protein ABIC35_001307 [Sphingomonas trueperi]